MAEKKETTKKEIIEVKPKEIKQIDYRPFINKILVCLYAIIVILVINTTALFLSLKDTNSTTDKNTQTGEENADYDVSMFDEKSITDVLNNTSGTQVVYVGRSSCGYCIQFLPNLKQAQNEFGYKTVYVDISKVTQEEYDKIAAVDTFFSKSFGLTPMLAIFRDGKYINGQVGYVEYETLSKFLTDNGVTKGE